MLSSKNIISFLVLFFLFQSWANLSYSQTDTGDNTQQDNSTGDDDSNDNDSDDEPDNKNEEDDEKEKEEHLEGHHHKDSDDDDDSPDIKFKYRIALEGMLTKGNINRSLINFRNNLKVDKEKYIFNNSVYYAQGTQNKNLAEEEVINNLSVYRFINKKNNFAIAGANTVEHSHLRKIKFRWQAGGGLSYYILRNDTNNLSVSNLILYESTDFQSILDYWTIRNSVRIKGYNTFFHKHLILIHETFFQPSILDLNNITFRSNVTFSLPLTKHTAFRFSFLDTYETIIRPGRKHNDLQLTFGVAVGN